MIALPTKYFTDAEINDVLRFKQGSNQVFFRYAVLRNGLFSRWVSAECTINASRFSQVFRSAQFVLWEELDWLNEEIKPIMYLRMPDELSTDDLMIRTWNDRDALGYTWNTWDDMMLDWNLRDKGFTVGETVSTGSQVFAEFPLGVFVPTSPKKSVQPGLIQYDVEAYDRVINLTEDSFDDPYYIEAGTVYTEAIAAILSGSGIEQVRVTALNTDSLVNDIEFEPGTKKATAVNQLLNDIGFASIWCDGDGNFMLGYDIDETSQAATIVYEDDTLSVIAYEGNSTADFYNVPNVFIAVCSGPDNETSIFSRYINDDPGNPLSTVNRGRRICSEVYQADNVTTQEALDAYIQRVAFLNMNVLEQIDFVTALMPIHGRGEILNIDCPVASGIFIESSWEFPCVAGGQMAHHARRSRHA